MCSLFAARVRPFRSGGGEEEAHHTSGHQSGTSHGVIEPSELAIKLPEFHELCCLGGKEAAEQHAGIRS